jgi:hypothetical protein
MKISQRNLATNRQAIPTTPEIHPKSKFCGTNLSNSNKTKELLHKQSPKTPPKTPQNRLENTQKSPNITPLLPPLPDAQAPSTASRTKKTHSHGMFIHSTAYLIK